MPFSSLPASTRFETRQVHFEPLSATSSPGPEPVILSGLDETLQGSLFPPLSSATRARTDSNTSRASSSSSRIAPSEIRIQYYDSSAGKNVVWRPFVGWKWATPALLLEAVDWNNNAIRVNTIVKLISSFSTLDPLLSQAILDHVVPPSQAPAVLARTSSVGSHFKVLQLFTIGGVAWLACLPVSEAAGFASTTGPGQPGFVPLKAVLASGNPPADVPRHFTVPLHSSARSVQAVYRFLDGQGRMRNATVAGVISSSALSYFEILEGQQQMQVKWFHIPYSRMLQLQRDQANPGHLLLKLRESGRERDLHIHLQSGNDAASFYEDVLYMHRQWELSLRQLT